MSESNEKSVTEIKLPGMELPPDEEITEPAEIPTTYAVTQYNISWLGSPGATNSAVVSSPNFNSSNKLRLSAVITGTPTWGTACTITAIPTNCTLKSGKSKVVTSIDGGSLGITILMDVTPAASYNGKTVTFSVSIAGASSAIFYANGGF